MEDTLLTYDELVSLREAQWEKDRDRKRRQWDADRFMDREADPRLHGVWVVYAWMNGVWNIIGFRRRRKRRKPQSLNKFFAKARRRLEIDKKVPIKIMDLHEARLRARRGDPEWTFQPPAYQPRRTAPVNVKPPLIVTTKWKRRATVRALKVNKKTTRFIAIGRNRWDRDPGFLFLGPLKAQSKLIATNEARKLFPIYNELLVLGVQELSEPLRHSMFRAKKVRAGVTRIQWPEVPPTFEEMWHRFLRWMERRGVDTAHSETLITLEMALRLEWAAQKNPWLTVKWMRKVLKQTKPSRGDVPCEPGSARTKQARSARRKPKPKAKKKTRVTLHQRSVSHRTKQSQKKSAPKRRSILRKKQRHRTSR